MAGVCLRSLSEGEQVSEDKEAIQVQEMTSDLTRFPASVERDGRWLSGACWLLQIAADVIAHSIGVEPGLFEVSDLPEPEKPEQRQSPGTQSEDSSHVVRYPTSTAYLEVT